MYSIVFSISIYCVLFVFLYRFLLFERPLISFGRANATLPIFLFLAAFLFRALLALYTPGYATDMACWRGWAHRAFSEGPWGFYSPDVFCDYPPGYLYVLLLLGSAEKLFPVLSPAFQTLLLKLPAILADAFLCVYLYKKAIRKEMGTPSALAISLLLVFCPALWINSAVWGQVDSLFSAALLFALVFLAEKKYYKSAALFSISVLLKPQALLLSPLFLLSIWRERKMPQFWKTLFGALTTFACVFLLLVLPFAITKNPGFIPSLYLKTLSSYPYASLNAFNFFTLLGANGVLQTETFAHFPYWLWGTIGVAASVILSSFLFLRAKDASRFFFCGALLLFGVFLFGAKMHERYLFPAVLFFFFAYVYRRDMRILFLAFFVSLLHFGNVAYIYLLSQEGIYYALAPNKTASLLSFFHLLAFLYALYVGMQLYPGKARLRPVPEIKTVSVTRRDVGKMITVTLLYATLAFTNLGNTFAPTTPADAEGIADFGAVRSVASASVYTGLGHSTVYFEFSEDGTSWSMPVGFETPDCFKWETYTLNALGRFVRVRFSGGAATVYEAAFYDADGVQIPLSSSSALFDEQNLCSPAATHLNSTYFDEIYHARSAFEHIEYLPHYETTHPPLGKLLIGIGIRFFGMNPFGWRFMGTLFGTLMLPLIFVFAKRLFKSSFLALISMLLMAFDCMHFSQTRIATIDSFPVFFILLMYYFMYRFYEEAEVLPLGKVCLFLGLSGVSFGLAIASKWIGFYGGIGLAILFFIALYRRIRKKNLKELLICVPCLLFFVVIPFIIYYVSYIPIHIADGAESFWENFWRYQTHMFSYHSKLTAEHPFSSMWYTWPLVLRPVWYYGNPALAAVGKASSIVGMGNPLLWWTSAVATGGLLLYLPYALWKRRPIKQALFIGMGYLSQLLPWAIISRVVFIYHYFASLPFAILALVYGFRVALYRFPFARRAICIFTIASGIVFLAFYPVLSGAVVPKSYVLSCLKWLASWTLCY